MPRSVSSMRAASPAGEVVSRGEVATRAPALEELVREVMEAQDLVVGQEVGTMAYLVHDVMTGAGATVLSFNAQQLRLIAASRKKTNRRDAYRIARALQTGMHPHPVYIPTGEIRELRGLLQQRRMLVSLVAKRGCTGIGLPAGSTAVGLLLSGPSADLDDNGLCHQQPSEPKGPSTSVALRAPV